MTRFTTASQEETADLGRALGRRLAGGEVIAFTGGLGAGKTTFCRGLAGALSCIDPVASPTFAIANLYRGAVPLAHFDAYRLESGDELEAAGFFDYLDTGAVAAVEWSERVANILPADCIRVDIEVLDEHTRAITIEGAGF